MNKRFFYKLFVVLVLLLTAFIIKPDRAMLRIAIYAMAYLLAGYDVLFSAGRNMLNGQLFDENFLMSIATLGAFIIGRYSEAVAVMLFIRSRFLPKPRCRQVKAFNSSTDGHQAGGRVCAKSSGRRRFPLRK